MVGLMACCRQSSSSFIVHSGGFAIRSRIVALSNVSGRFGPECDAPEQRIAAEDNPFAKPLSNVYSVVPCRFCQGTGLFSRGFQLFEWFPLLEWNFLGGSYSCLERIPTHWNMYYLDTV